MVDKILVSNNAALQTKYGPQVGRVHRAAAKLIQADRSRGLKTLYLALDDPRTMGRIESSHVTHPSDTKQNKGAIDAVYHHYKPHYLVLLGSTDIIPHQELTNPLFNPTGVGQDEDAVVPSDLPYACNAPYSAEAEHFVGPTRVVSRLPDVTGSHDPSYLIGILDMASKALPRTHEDYADCLALSTAVWSESTHLSLRAIFGSARALQQVPPHKLPLPRSMLALRSHYFNCHGLPRRHRYWGQSGQQHPVAFDSAHIAGKVSLGTLVAAECCYGAQLYDPGTLTPASLPIANARLSSAWGTYFHPRWAHHSAADRGHRRSRRFRSHEGAFLTLAGRVGWQSAAGREFLTSPRWQQPLPGQIPGDGPPLAPLPG